MAVSAAKHSDPGMEDRPVLHLDGPTLTSTAVPPGREPDTERFPAPALAVQKSGDIEMVVPRNARPGRYQYVIYCHDTDEFAMGDGHPIMEIAGL